MGASEVWESEQLFTTTVLGTGTENGVPVPYLLRSTVEEQLLYYSSSSRESTVVVPVRREILSRAVELVE